MALEELHTRIKTLQDEDKKLREARDEAELSEMLSEHPEYFSPTKFVVEAFPLVKPELPGHVVLRLASIPEQQQLRETLLSGGAEAKGKAFGTLARRCRVHPEEKVYLEMLKEHPGISDHCAASVMTASDGKEKEAKKG